MGELAGYLGLFAFGEFAQHAVGWGVEVSIAVDGEDGGLAGAGEGDLAAALGVGAVGADGAGGVGGFAIGGKGDGDDATVVGVALDLAAAAGDGETGERDQGARRDASKDGFHVVSPKFKPRGRTGLH